MLPMTGLRACHPASAVCCGSVHDDPSPSGWTYKPKARIHLASCYATMPHALCFKDLTNQVGSPTSTLYKQYFCWTNKFKYLISTYINENFRRGHFLGFDFFSLLDFTLLHISLEIHCRHPCKQVIFITQSCRIKGRWGTVGLVFDMWKA